jgi:hypothetical protein
VSNLMQVLANARDARRGSGHDAASHGDQVMADRLAEANALAHAGANDTAFADACHRLAAAAERIAALERRQQAEELATAHARSRAEADAAAEETLVRQAHAERMAELALRTRIEHEEQARINAQRREFAAAELAKAAHERARREAELARQAEQRLAAEHHAAELAADAARANQIAEAAALATQAAEQETARELLRRADLEAAEIQTGAARRDAERDAGQAKDRRAAAEAQLAEGRSKAATSPLPARSTGLAARRAWLMAALIGSLFGLGAGTWLATSGEAGRLAQRVGGEKPVPAALRLDTSTQNMAARIERANALEATRVRR